MHHTHTKNTSHTYYIYTTHNNITHEQTLHIYTLLTKTLCMYTLHTKHYIHTTHTHTIHATYRNLTHEYMLNTRTLHTHHTRNIQTQYYIHKYYAKLGR